MKYVHVVLLFATLLRVANAGKSRPDKDDRKTLSGKAKYNDNEDELPPTRKGKAKRDKKENSNNPKNLGNPNENDFNYPAGMPPPPEMWVEGFASRLHAQNIQKYETPIQVWQTWRLDQTMWNCIAHYHPTALNAITKADPMPRVPGMYHTSEARALCMIHAINKLIPDLVPISAATISGWLDDLGLDSSIMDDSDAKQSAMNGNPSPRVIGSLVAAEVIQDMYTDGWNYKGLMTPANGMCTANCRPFSDTYGYVPKNSPWELVDTAAWQPLIDSDGLGFFYAQEHVTPHIGFQAKPVILSRADLDAKKLDAPNYDYEVEIDMTLERTANLSNYQETMIKFMDNKINIAGGMIMRLRGKYALSLEAQVFYHYGYTSSEHDAVLLAWKEKIRHDRIRPTSIIRHLRGDDNITSFGETYKAKDWQALIPVMPHSEYPSGSGCICLAVAQFIDEFLSDQYGDSSIETTWDFENLGPVTFTDMMELADVCGESRLWGGMHFTPSVPDSYTLCDGVGTQGYTGLMKPLLGAGNYVELMDDSKVKYTGFVFIE
mmetsp:Transcript_12974/g.31623  ORF Transcript_12974/g.31623 Transcript_12974/m.31623 type:complete len:547 (+) Transcript_12974:209-1849(+)